MQRCRLTSLGSKLSAYTRVCFHPVAQSGLNPPRFELHEQMFLCTPYMYVTYVYAYVYMFATHAYVYDHTQTLQQHDAHLTTAHSCLLPKAFLDGALHCL